jgi:hypothetical protein
LRHRPRQNRGKSCRSENGRSRNRIPELKAREQRKLDPRRQDLVRRIVADHPEWDEEALQRLHDDLDAWGE